MASQDEAGTTAQEGEDGEDSKSGSQKDEAENDDDDDENFMFRVYFRKEEISMASASQ